MSPFNVYGLEDIEDNLSLFLVGHPIPDHVREMIYVERKQPFAFRFRLAVIVGYTLPKAFAKFQKD